METKKKKPNSLLIIVLIFVVLVAGYFIATTIINSNNEKKENQQFADATVTGIASVNSIIYDSSESHLEFNQVGSVWVNTENPTFPLKDATMVKYAGYLSDIEAIRVLDEPSSLSEYGLDDPQFRVTLNKDSADESVLLIGNEGTIGRYVKVDGNDKVYVIDSAITDYMITDVYQVLKFDLMKTFLQTEVVALDLDYNGSHYSYKLTHDGDNSKCVATKDGNTIDVSYAAVMASLDVIDMWTPAGCEIYDATDEEMVEHGFGEDKLAVITLDVYDVSEDNSFTVTLVFGGSDETGNYRYAEFDGSRQIVYGNIQKIDDAIYNIVTEGLTEFLGGTTVTDYIDPNVISN